VTVYRLVIAIPRLDSQSQDLGLRDL